jgi:osmotically-inducible protein OsmY
MQRRLRFDVSTVLVASMSVMLSVAVSRAESRPDPDTTMNRDSIGAGDDAIRRSVEEALSDLDSGDNGSIRVRVEDGVVWLTGSVPTWQGNASRLYATRSVTGVRSIMNGLHVVPLSPIGDGHE